LPKCPFSANRALTLLLEARRGTNRYDPGFSFYKVCSFELFLRQFPQNQLRFTGIIRFALHLAKLCRDKHRLDQSDRFFLLRGFSQVRFSSAIVLVYRIR